MANRFYVRGGSGIWDNTNNWSTSALGSPGASIPTSSDNVFIGPTFSPTSISLPTTNIYAVCNDLTIDTGLVEGFSFAMNGAGLGIKIHGTLSLIGHINNIITISDTLQRINSFLLLGTCGSISYVNATGLDSSGGKRIIYDSATCTIIRCPFWIDHAPITRHISSPSDLQNINNNCHDNYILDNDLDMSGVTWIPLGGDSFTDIDAYIYHWLNPFTGTFDGKGHTISNLTCTAFDSITVGPAFGEKVGAALFGRVGSAEAQYLGYFPDGLSGLGEVSIIHDVNLQNFNMHGENGTSSHTGISGSLAAHVLNGTIYNVTAKDINLDSANSKGYNIGGLIGYVNGWVNSPSTITNCKVMNLTINGANNTDCIGGLIGSTDIFNTSTFSGGVVIKNCSVINYNISNQHGNDGGVGGLIGSFRGTMDGCYAIGTIGNQSVPAVGIPQCGGAIGLISLVNSIITNCSCDVTFIQTTANLGGIRGGFVGFTSTSNTFYNCSANITFTSSANGLTYIGGFIAQPNSSDTISKCFATGNITLTGTGGSYHAGFVAYLTPYVIMHDCYSHVNVNSPNSSYVSGFVSYKSASLINCYASGNVTGSSYVGGFVSYGAWDTINCWSAGIVTGTTLKGGFAGYIYNGYLINIKNCSWYKSASANAIGDYNGSPIALLATNSNGTDESDNTKFYYKNHKVYAQGT